MILTSVQRSSTNPSLGRNKKVYICSLVLVMLAASPMRAAEPPATSSLLAPSADRGKLSIVRVDRRTGKLEMDFVIEKTKRSTHILNAVSPAFTASLAFADIVIDECL